MRYVIQDQVVFFWIGNTFTMFLFMFGALAVLRPAGIVPAEGQIVWDMSVILESSLGTPGRYVFLLIGMAALFSSQLAAVDGGARTWSYLLGSMFKFGKKRTQSQWYLTFAIMFMVAGTASTAFFELSGVSALGFIFNAALLGGFAMAIYVPLTLYVNLTKPAEVRTTEGAQHRDDADRVRRLRVLHPVHDLEPDFRVIGCRWTGIVLSARIEPSGGEPNDGLAEML